MRDGWRRSTLGEVADIRIGRTPPRNDPRYWTPDLSRPFCTIADMTASSVDPRREGVTEMAVREGKARPVPAGGLLLSFKLSIGRVGFAARTLYPNEAIAWLRPCNGDFDPRYLAYWLEHEDLTTNASRAAKGQTLNSSSLQQLRVVLPPLLEQRRIVDLMAALDAQRTASQRLATSAAQLAVVVFEAEAGEFELVELGSVVDRVDAGRSPMTYGRPPRPGERGVLKVSAVQPGVYVPSESKAVSEDAVLDPRWEVRAGDILMTRANTPERVGAVCRVMDSPPDLYLSDKTLRLVPTLDQVDSAFLVVAIGGRRARAQLSAGATGTSASMFNISQEKIRQVRIPFPPLEIQRSVVAKVSAAQSTATAAHAVTEAVEGVRRSLLQDLLSGRHEIPRSYDRFIEAAS